MANIGQISDCYLVVMFAFLDFIRHITKRRQRISDLRVFSLDEDSTTNSRIDLVTLQHGSVSDVPFRTAHRFQNIAVEDRCSNRFSVRF